MPVSLSDRPKIQGRHPFRRLLELQRRLLNPTVGDWKQGTIWIMPRIGQCAKLRGLVTRVALQPWMLTRWKLHYDEKFIIGSKERVHQEAVRIGSGRE